MAEEVLGSGISKGVTDQLLLRESLIGERNKSKNHLLFLNSNGAWIRLASSINTLDKTNYDRYHTPPSPEPFTGVGPATEEQTLAQLQGPQIPENIVGSNELATGNVLFGGMYPQNQKPDGGILSEKWHKPLSIDKNGFYKSGNSKTANYHNYESIGHRPVPGITSVSVQSKNTYGTLREAEVKVTVWTLEDLEIMQALYLRPGYSILLEWGHSLGLDNGGLLKDPLVYQDFFKAKQKQKSIEEYLITNAQDNSYNYDGMYGYVSNFSWEFRQDGGYDCTVKIISKGSILESLRVSFDISQIYPPSQITPGDTEESKTERKSIYHKFLVELRKADFEIQKSPLVPLYPNNPPSNATTQLDELNGQYAIVTKKAFEKIPTAQNFYSSLNNFVAFPLPINFDETSEDGETSTLGKTLFYVPLYVLLDIYNNYLALVDTSGDKKDRKKDGTQTGGYKYTQFYTGWQDEFTDPTQPEGQAYLKSNKFLTTDYHFSINPTICALPGQFMADRDIKFKDENCNDIQVPNPKNSNISFDTRNLGSIQIRNFDLAVNQTFNTPRNQNKIKGQRDDILNILISLDHFVDLIDQAHKQDKDPDQNTSNNMTVILQNLLKDVNNALGGVNDLDTLYDESEDLYYIQDRRLTPSSIDTVPEIKLAGINSTINNLSISSKISSNISSQISIAAQGGNAGTKDNIGPLLQWNKGLIDRHLPKKNLVGYDPSQKRKSQADELTKWLTDYLEVWSNLLVDTREVEVSTDFLVLTTGLTTLPSVVFFKVKEYKILDKESLDNLSSLESYHKVYCQKYVAEYFFKSEVRNPPPGVIPVELSFSTIGIAGLKIGQSFRIQKGILPESYSKDFGFIITGLSHSIENNKWTTDVKTQFFCIRPLDMVEVKKYKQEIGLTCPPGTNTSTQPSANTPNADRLRAVLRSLGYVEKGEEISNGGDITEQLYRYAASVFRKIKELYPDIGVTVTGGNDIYHQNVTYRSSHAAGLGLDFVIAPETPSNKLKVEKILGGFAGGNQDKSASFINEYDYPTTAATAGHFHIKIGGSIEGNPVTSDYIAQANNNQIQTYRIT